MRQLKDLTEEQIEHIAKVAHDAYVAVACVMSDNPPPIWDGLPDDAKGHEFGQVCNVAGHIETSPRQMHEVWCERMIATGWQYGEMLSAVAKRSPFLVAYEELPKPMRIEQEIRYAIIRRMLEGPAEKAVKLYTMHQIPRKN